MEKKQRKERGDEKEKVILVPKKMEPPYLLNSYSTKKFSSLGQSKEPIKLTYKKNPCMLEVAILLLYKEIIDIV